MLPSIVRHCMDLDIVPKVVSPKYTKTNTKIKSLQSETSKSLGMPLVPPAAY